MSIQSKEPAAPLPFYETKWFRTRIVCQCGERFKAEALYNQHWIIAHS